MNSTKKEQKFYYYQDYDKCYPEFTVTSFQYVAKPLPCTGYGSRDGNNLDNFAMPWNIDKIFGMLRTELPPTKLPDIFLIDAKIG